MNNLLIGIALFIGALGVAIVVVGALAIKLRRVINTGESHEYDEPHYW